MIVVRAPHTGEVLAEVPTRTAEEVARAVARGRDVFATWSQVGVRQRARVLGKVRDLVVRERSRLMDVMISETGKVRGEAVTEMTMLLDTLRYWLDEGPQLLGERAVTPRLLKHKRAWIRYEPRGVVGIISPWNFPLDLGFGEVFPALLAGNAVVLKPSELTPLVSLEAERIAAEAGLPDGLFQVMTGAGETGAALCEHVDQITFTGSAAVGRKVATVAAQRLIPCTLELGGKDPMVVLRDADLERAAAGAVWGAFFNSGQMCMSVERVYVEEPVHDAFLDLVVRKTEALRQGVDGQFTQDVGSMTRPAQVELVEAHVADALARGARVLTGGARGGGATENFYPPTVLADVDHSMVVMRDETFGPLMPVMAVSGAAEAVRLANDSPYGLNASVWSGDADAGRRVAAQIRSGSVCVNDVVISYGLPEVPFGGVKESGVGSRHGPGGVRKYCEEQVIVADRLGLKSEPHWYPYKPRLMGAVERASAVFGGIKGLLGR